MAFGKSLVLCSPFSGRAMTQAGEPAAGITVVRTWKWGWNDKTGTDRTTTDENGKFSFPVVNGSSFSASLLPHEPNVLQTITAHTDSGEVEIWSATKKTYDLNSEMKGRPVHVKCFVDKEPSADGLYWGTCVEDDKP